MSSDWNETRTIMNELEQLFHLEDDIRDISDIKKMKDEIDLHFSRSITDAKELIKLLSSQVSQKESEISIPTEAEHSSHVTSLIQEKEQLRFQIETGHSELNSRKESITKTESELRETKFETTDLASKQCFADNQTAHGLSLYHTISNISWNYQKCLSHGGKLSGTIANSRKKSVLDFEVDPTRATSFEVANTLWGLVEESLQDEIERKDE